MRSPGIRTLAGAAACGALCGLLEAAEILLRSRLLLSAPMGLLVVAALSGLALGLPGALLGLWRGWRRAPLAAGFVGAAAVAGLLELCLAVMQDPPPFQEPPWYVGSPLALALGVAGLALGAAALSRVGRLGAVIAAVLVVGGQLPGGRALPPRGAGAEGPNLLLVTLDTTRADRCSAYGGRAETPSLQALAAEGLRFDAAFSPIAVTGPSHTSLMSGQGTWSHGVLLNGVPAPRERPLLAERARAAGYRTAAFVSAYVLERRIGLDRGFAIYDDDFSTLRGAGGLLGARLLAAASRRLSPNEVLERRGDHTVDLATEWLGQVPEGEPWLLWVHLFDAHGPYAPPPPYDSLYYQGDPRDPAHTSMAQVGDVAPYLAESLAGITDVEQVIAWYDGEIHFADAQLGRLLAALEARGEAEDTVVVVMGDHGESLGEHGVWFDHGDDVYDASLRVPLVLRGPGIPAGQARGEVVETLDVLPTVVELLDLPAVEGADGRSLLAPRGGGLARSLIFDREANLAGRAAGEITRPTWRMVGLRSPSTLFVRREAEGYVDAVYRSPEGSGYQEMSEVDYMSVLLSQPDGRAAVGALRAQADALLDAGLAGVERSGIELSPEERARLEALGYLE